MEAPSWLSYLLFYANAVGPERFSEAAELAAPLLAAKIAGKLVERHHEQTYYRHLFELSRPGYIKLIETEYDTVPFERVKGKNGVTKHIGKNIEKGKFKVAMERDYRGFYAVHVVFEGVSCSTYRFEEYCKRDKKTIGHFWLGTPKPGGRGLLLSPEYTRFNINWMPKLSNSYSPFGFIDFRGLDPYSFIDLFEDVATAWGFQYSTYYPVVGKSVSNAARWAALVTRAAMHEVERLSRVAADSQTVPAVVEMTEEIRWAALAAYNGLLLTGTLVDPGSGYRTGSPSDGELLVAHTMEVHIKIAEHAWELKRAKVDIANSMLDELVNDTVHSAAADRAIVEVLASLSEPVEEAAGPQQPETKQQVGL